MKLFFERGCTSIRRNELAGTRPLERGSRLPHRSPAQAGSCSSVWDASPSTRAWQVSAPPFWGKAGMSTVL